MKNKILISKICSITIAIVIISVLLLAFLGRKEREGYLSNFKINIDETLQINGLNINETKQLFTINNKLNETAINNFIFTNKSITNYNYNFRIKYYSKIFRNSDIYNVYPNLDNIPEYIQSIKMDNNIGTPFGTMISTNKFNYDDKIENISYILKLKKTIIIFVIILLSIIIIYLINKLVIYIIEHFNLYINKNNYYFDTTVKENKNFYAVYIAVFILFFPIIYLFYEYIYSSVPYYYAWDSTYIYSRDILLVSSNLMPEHLLHPNISPLVLFKYIFIPIGKLFNIISITNITELENSVNPYLAFVEFTEYALSVCRISFFIFITIMYVNMIKLLNICLKNINNLIAILFSISIIIIFSFSEFILKAVIPNKGYGFTFISVIRYENFGLLLASISLYFVIKTYDTNNCYSFKHKLYLIISAIFVGAAILSKIQLGGWVIGIFLIYIMLNFNKYYEIKKNKDINIDLIFIVLVISTILLITLNIIIFYFHSNNKIEPSAFLIGADSLKYSRFIIPIFFIILSVILSLIKFRILKINNYIILFLKNFIIYSLSCLAALFFCLFLPNAIDTLFTAYIFVYSFGAVLVFIGSQSIHGVAASKSILYIQVFSLCSLFFFYFLHKNKKRIFNNTITANIFVNLVLVLFSIVYVKALRIDGTDFTISMSLFAVSLILLAINIISLIKNNNIITILFCLMFIFVFIFVYKNKDYSYYSTSYNYPIYDWKYFTYGTKNGRRFINMLNKAYPTHESWDIAFKWSKNTRQIKLLLKQINIQNNSLNDTIIACNNSPISVINDEIISNIDEKLHGGLMVPIKNDGDEIFLRADYRFYLISDKKLENEDHRTEYLNYNFYINDDKYFVYKLNMNIWQELNYGYNGHFIFRKGSDFYNRAFILINDK